MKDVQPILVRATHVEKFFPGLSPKTLANLRAQGRGPRYFRRGRLVFYRPEDVKMWIEQQETKTIDQSD